MRLPTIICFLASAPLVTRAFAPTSTSNGGSITSTSLAVRRLMLPSLRRPSLFFPDFDRMFEEMNEMMEDSLTIMQRPFADVTMSQGLQLRRPLGFDVTQDDHEYKVAINVPEVDPKDLELQLDHNGRVLRLKGERTHEEGGMKIMSKFEKSILLSPDIDTNKLKANMSRDTLTVVAPKIERKEIMEKVEPIKIDITLDEPTALTSSTETPTAPAIESADLNNSKVEVNKQFDIKNEPKWPVKDFPY